MGRGDKIGESGGRCRPLAGLHTRRRFMPWKWYTIGNEREACIVLKGLTIRCRITIW